MDILDILRAALRRWWVVLLVVLVLLPVILLLPRPAASFEADGSFIITTPNDDFESIPILVAQRVEDRAVRERVTSEESVRVDYAVIGSGDGLVTVRATSTSGDAAIRVTERVLDEIGQIVDDPSTLDEFVEADTDIAIDFGVIKRPGEPVSLGVGDTGATLLEVDGSGVVTISGVGASLGPTETLGQIQNRLTTQAMVQEMEERTGALVEIGGGGRDPIASIRATAETEEEAQAGFEVAVEEARALLEELRGRTAVNDRVELEVLLDAVVSRQPANPLLLLVGLVGLSVVLAIAIAVAVDSVATRRDRDDAPDEDELARVAALRARVGAPIADTEQDGEAAAIAAMLQSTEVGDDGEPVDEDAAAESSDEEVVSR